MCKEHNWDCVAGQRQARLGFLSHPADSLKVVGFVGGRNTLCLEQCCWAVNTRLFGCVRTCCWGRVYKADTVCKAPCCGGDGEQLEEGLVIYIEEEKEEVLGFVHHNPHLPVTKKVLSPLTRGDQLCNESCCLYDNMMIFEADNWTALKNVRLKK